MGDLREYFEGKKLYGDDFNLERIKAWYEDEKEAYADLVRVKDKYVYIYHGLNWEFGFRFLPDSGEFHHVLGFGSAYGYEFTPLIKRIDKITIVEPSERFASDQVEGKPLTYVRPTFSGDLPFQGNYFDLITCFGVLHHIPNVTKIVNEFYRCLKPGGYLLVREPINSMGDWTKPRKGLTKRERGIPLPIFQDIVASSGFEIVREQRFGHMITKRIIRGIYKRVFNNSIYNSTLVMKIDKFLSKYLYVNRQYHPLRRYRGPSASGVFFVLRK